MVAQGSRHSNGGTEHGSPGIFVLGACPASLRTETTSPNHHGPRRCSSASARSCCTARRSRTRRTKLLKCSCSPRTRTLGPKPAPSPRGHSEIVGFHLPLRFDLKAGVVQWRQVLLSTARPHASHTIRLPNSGSESSTLHRLHRKTPPIKSNKLVPYHGNLPNKTTSTPMALTPKALGRLLAFPNLPRVVPLLPNFEPVNPDTTCLGLPVRTAAPLGWCQRAQWGGSPMAVPDTSCLGNSN